MPFAQTPKLRHAAIVVVLGLLASLASTIAAPSADAQGDEIIDALTIVRPTEQTAVPTPAPLPQPTAIPQPTPTPQPTPVPQPTAVPATINAAGFPSDVAALIPQSTLRWLEATGWKTEWRQGPGPGRQAEAQYATRTIVIWRTANRPTAFWVGAFGHELGHAVSQVHLSSAQKQQWTQARGLSTWSWVPGMPNDFSVGEGDFAEAFMNYLLGHPIRSAGGPLSQADINFIRTNTGF